MARRRSRLLSTKKLVKQFPSCVQEKVFLAEVKNLGMPFDNITFSLKAVFIGLQIGKEVPECDKRYPEGYYNLAYLSLQEHNVEEASKWKDKGEEAEEKRLPFLPPFDSAIKEQYLRVLDFFPLSKKHNKKQTTRSSSSAGRNQDHATGNNNERETKTCTKCKKMLQEMKWCPCKKAFYCGR